MGENVLKTNHEYKDLYEEIDAGSKYKEVFELYQIKFERGEQFDLDREPTEEEKEKWRKHHEKLEQLREECNCSDCEDAEQTDMYISELEEKIVKMQEENERLKEEIKKLKGEPR